MAAEVWFDAREELADVLESRATVRRAEAEQVRGIAAWAAARTTSQRGPLRVLPGQERRVPFGGPGSPDVPEFLPAELGATLGLSAFAAQKLLSDALSLVHRLPDLLTLLEQGEVDAWKVRMVAAATRELPQTVTGIIDCQLAAPARRGAPPRIVRLTRSTLQDVIDHHVRAHTDPTQTTDAHHEAQARRYIAFKPGLDGTTDIAGTLSNEDARRLEQHLDHTASEMADTEGDTRSKNVRRAEALGRLVVHPGLAQTVLYLHFDRVSGTWSADDIGTISADEAETIVGHGNVTIKPVIDLAAEITTTGYVAPPRLREQLRLAQRNLCAFPHCDRHGTTRFDVDHVTPHDEGGATTSSNTHLLCRYHHRVKTHSRWRATKTAPGTTTWTSPTGQVFEVAHGLTTRLRT
ncbi:MAG: DUF222 domain-containing protein [Nocardioidaceae bacterium]|nr:DUF222 domain-containing protein [Nocardioidaceae bacterium]